MKKIIVALIVALGATLPSCSNLDDQPPLNDGYKTEFVIPAGELLNDEDRAYLDAIEEEYEQNAK